MIKVSKPSSDDKLEVGTRKEKTVELVVAGKTGFITEHVEVNVTLTGYPRGKVDISLVSPSGMESPLQNNHAKDTGTNMDWRFWSVRHWGENPNGTWKVKFVNNAPKEGRLHSLQLNIYGYYPSPTSS